MTRAFSKRLVCAIAGLLAMCGATAQAANLVVGMRNEPGSLDPHYLWAFTNSMSYYHYMGYLVRITPQGGLAPSIATQWESQGDDSWIFKLNPKAKFSDGSPVTAEDVVASYKRAANYSGGGLRGLFALVERYETPDPHTLRIITREAYPTLPFSMTQVAIIPKAIAEKATGKDFLLVQNNVSAGPYMMVEYRPGAELVLKANPHYWEQPKWDNVTLRYISDPSARVAALMSGGVDMIDGVLPEDIDEIEKRPNLKTVSGRGGRMIYFAMDQSREVTPEVSGNDGKPLPVNPFKDARVRKALTLAIDRQLIVARIMRGKGGPLTQMGVDGQGGFDPGLPVIPYDPEQAKTLLKEAGYPDGFRMTVTCPGGYLVNDSRVCQAVGQMLARVGIKAEVSVVPWSVLTPRATCHCDRRPSFFMSTWSNAYSGEIGVALSNLLRSYDKTTGRGGWNQGEYASTPALDALIDKAFTTIEPETRHKLQREAMAKAMADYPVVPIYYQGVTLASRKGITPTPYSIEYTIAESVTQDK